MFYSWMYSTAKPLIVPNEKIDKLISIYWIMQCLLPWRQLFEIQSKQNQICGILIEKSNKSHNIKTEKMQYMSHLNGCSAVWKDGSIVNLAAQHKQYDLEGINKALSPSSLDSTLNTVFQRRLLHCESSYLRNWGC